MSIYDKNFDVDFISAVNNIFEADDNEPDSIDNIETDDTSTDSNTNNIEIAPPPEGSEVKNSDSFIENKVVNSYIDNDPAVHNLVQIISEDMMDQDKLKGYVEVFFTRIGLNDVDSEKFKILSSEIWNKLEELTEVDPKASLAEFTSWAHDKIGQYNR